MGKWSHRIASALDRLGHKSTIWFAEQFPTMAVLGRLSVLAFPFALATKVRRSRTRFDAIVVHEPAGWVYAILRRLNRRLPPMVLMCHNVESKVFADLVHASSNGFANVPLVSRFKVPLFRRWQSNLGIRLADQVVCLSRSDENYIQNELRRQPNSVTRLTNGVEPEFLTIVRRPLSNASVLFVGGWFDIKGRRILPSIWSLVHRACADASLTLVGTGADRDAVLQDFPPEARASVNVIPRITSACGMQRAFAEHSVLLVPSLSEGSSLALIESMAVGTPVVAARVGGILDIVTDNVDGLLFDATNLAQGAEKVCTLLSDTAMAMRLGLAARERARQLTWDSCARGLMSAVDKGTETKTVVQGTRSQQASG
jgi:glycosyltransferase involved in cell wall biosynthesis